MSGMSVHMDNHNVDIWGGVNSLFCERGQQQCSWWLACRLALR